MENQTYQEVVKFRGDEIVAVLFYEELSDNPEVEDAYSDGKDYVVVFADRTRVYFRVYNPPPPDPKAGGGVGGEGRSRLQPRT